MFKENVNTSVYYISVNVKNICVYSVYINNYLDTTHNSHFHCFHLTAVPSTFSPYCQYAYLCTEVVCTVRTVFTMRIVSFTVSLSEGGSQLTELSVT